MNTFYIYTLSLEDYEGIANNPNLSGDKRRLKFANHLLVSGTNRRVMTQLLDLVSIDAMPKSALSRNDFYVYGLHYEQVQEVLNQEVQLAAGHFSHTIHKVNLATFYYLSFATHRALTAVLIKDEYEGISTRGWEGKPPELLNRWDGF